MNCSSTKLCIRSNLQAASFLRGIRNVLFCIEAWSQQQSFVFKQIGVLLPDEQISGGLGWCGTFRSDLIIQTLFMLSPLTLLGHVHMNAKARPWRHSTDCLKPSQPLRSVLNWIHPIQSWRKRFLPWSKNKKLVCIYHFHKLNIRYFAYCHLAITTGGGVEATTENNFVPSFENGAKIGIWRFSPTPTSLWL